MVRYPGIRPFLAAIDISDCKLLNDYLSIYLTRILTYIQQAILAILLLVVGFAAGISGVITVDGLAATEDNGPLPEDTTSGSGLFMGTFEVEEVPFVLVMFWSLTIFFGFSVLTQFYAAHKLRQATNPDLPFAQKMKFIDFWFNVNAVFCLIEFFFCFLMSEFLLGVVCVGSRIFGFVTVGNYIQFLTKKNFVENPTKVEEDKTSCKV